jgi:hypothetical protein
MNQHTIRGTAGNGVFYSGPCRGVIRERKLQLSSVGRELPFRKDMSPEAATVKAVTRQLLVKTLWAGKDF